MGAFDSKIYVRAGSYHNIAQTIQNNLDLTHTNTNTNTSHHIEQGSNVNVIIIPLSAILPFTLHIVTLC